MPTNNTNDTKKEGNAFKKLLKGMTGKKFKFFFKMIIFIFLATVLLSGSLYAVFKNNTADSWFPPEFEEYEKWV